MADQCSGVPAVDYGTAVRSDTLQLLISDASTSLLFKPGLMTAILSACGKKTSERSDTFRNV